MPELKPTQTEADPGLPPGSVEMTWNSTGDTVVNTIGSRLLSMDDSERSRYTNDVLRDMHVMMNGHVGDRASSVGTKRKIIDMVRLGLEEEMTDPVTREVYEWYLETKDEKAPLSDVSRSQALDQILTDIAATSGDQSYLSVREAEAGDSTLFTQVRLAAFLAYNSLDLFYKDTSIFTRVAMQGSKKFKARFKHTAELAEGQRKDFVGKAIDKRLDVYLDLDKTRAIIEKLDIEVHDPGTGVINHLAVQEHPRLAGQANGRTGTVRILEDIAGREHDEQLTEHSINHELVHMVSAKDFLTEDEKTISMGFRYASSQTDGFDGTIFNEGMTESITESLLDDPMGIYRYEVETLNVIFGSDEDSWNKALHLFFNGSYQPGEEIPIVELIDSILGKGAGREIDTIYQREGPKAAFRHAKQLKKQSLSSV